MFLGHFALAYAVKPAAPKVNLGALFLGAQLADTLWPALVLAKTETVAIQPGDTVFTPLRFEHYPYSHSLQMLTIWGLFLGGVYFLFKRDARGAAVLWLLTISHWVLDWISHREDMPLTLSGSQMYGLGLWNSKVATLVVESLLFVFAALIYFSRTRASDKVGRYASYCLLALLVIIYLANSFGPPPPSVQVIAYSGLLGAPLLMGLAWWADKHRTAV